MRIFIQRLNNCLKCFTHIITLAGLIIPYYFHITAPVTCDFTRQVAIIHITFSPIATYPFILLGKGMHIYMNTLPKDATRSGVEPGTPQSQVQHPNHHTTEAIYYQNHIKFQTYYFIFSGILVMVICLYFRNKSSTCNSGI